MLYFPFIYFTTLLLAVIRKRGFDMSAYMIFIYAISSFFSIILYNQNYDYDLVYFSKSIFLLFLQLFIVVSSLFVSIRSINTTAIV